MLLHNSVNVHCTLISLWCIQCEDDFDKGKKLSKNLGKPRENTAKALASLFPTLQGRKRKFDPSSECVVSGNQRKKKAGNPGSSGRPKVLKVVCLQDIPPTIPKGRARDALSREGKIKELPIRRNMSIKDVLASIRTCFAISDSKEVVYLQAHRDNTVNISEEQSLDGCSVIRLAGSGSLYVKIQEKRSSQESSSIGSPLDSSSSNRDKGIFE